MAVHIFVVSEENFEICKKRGLVAIPEPKEDSRNRDNIYDGLPYGKFFSLIIPIKIKKNGIFVAGSGFKMSPDGSRSMVSKMFIGGEMIYA